MGDSPTLRSLFVAGLGALLLLGAVACRPAAGGSPAPTPPGDGTVTPSGSETPGWQEVDRLIDERKFQAALDRVTELRESAQAAGDEAEWTRALVREVQLMTGLHGYESSVRHLNETAWPERPLYRTVLDLYRAQSLVHYLQVYGWEIGQRERVESPAEDGGEPDLKAWTREQIGEEIEAIYARIWTQREAWGDAPLGELATYFIANDFPPRVRGTLRDAVTYLWVERLADSSTWSAAEENGVYRLDLEALIDGEAPDAGEEVEPHPLERLATRLADLEAWHRQAGRDEAAFEARLERLRRLWSAFSRDDDRVILRAALAGALDRLGRGQEWWSVGQEQLARWVAEGDGPGSQIEARELALAGLDAHPGSIGGQRCRHLVASIEAPEYHLEAMRADGAHQRSVRVRHRNLEALAFRAYRLDPLAAIEGAEDYNLLPGHREVEELLAGAEPVAAWRLELPATPDYRLHETYLKPPVGLPGLYVLVASARGDFEDGENRKVAVQIVVGELVLLTRRLEDGLEVTVHEGRSGAAAPGVEVRLYEYNWRQGHNLKATRRTGPDGTAHFAAGRWRRATYFAVAVRGDQVALDPSYLDLERRREPQESTGALIYTDRSVYRPGQEVLWKAVAYKGLFEEGSWAVERGRAFTVELRDANNELVESANVTANDYGSASGRFTLPHGRLLGAWRLQASNNGSSMVRVEEYKRPTFEVEIAEPAEPLRLNRAASLRGEARYYFGLPVAGGEVSWQVTREPVWSFRHWWWRPPPSSAPETVAAGTGRLAADGGFTVDFTPAADERRAEEGTSFRYRLSVDVTDEGGETRSASRSFRLGFVAVEAAIELERGFLEAGEPGEASIRRADLDGAPRAGSGSWWLLRVAQPEAALLPAEQPVALAPDDESHHTPGDLLRPRWDPGLSPAAALASWPDAEELVRGELEHGEDGLAGFRLPALLPGVYRIRYETRDPWGARFESARELVVAEPGETPLALPAVLLTERSAVPVGETIRLLVHSGLDDQELVLELLRGERRIERRRLDSAAGLQIVELPATAEHRGGLGVRLTVLRDHQLMSFTESVHVPWDDRRLELSFSSFRDRLRPGTAESWRVTVRGAGEEALAAGAAELLAYMYDRSLDLFAPHQPPDVAALYPLRGAPRAPETSLGVGGEIWARQFGWADLPNYPHLGGDHLVFYDGYDIGGPGRRAIAVPMAMQQMRREGAVAMMADGNADVEAEGMVLDELRAAKVPMPDPTPDEPEPPGEAAVELRTDFSETAFWEPHLVLGDDGTVAFEFTVPDSVTEWSVWVHALTRDLAGGSLERRSRSVKELMVRPYLPRFLREGDRAVIKVVVNNASEGPLAGSLALDLEDPETGDSLLAEFGLDPEAVAAVPFRVEPGGGAELEFELQAPIRVGEVAVRAVARAGELSDGELRPLPLLPGRLHLAQSRFAALEGDDRRELTFPDLAAAADDPTLAHDQLVVTLDGQLFTSVLRALPYLVSYPYECTEQTANRFISTGILTSLYDDYPAVARLAKQLAERERQFEPWDAGDPNRKMALVETPWRVQARGGRERDDLIRVLDPKIARAQERSALAKLEKSQTSLGGFPWWPGGPPSPYMTLYLLHGFAKAVEFDVEVPQPMVRRAWSYMHRHYLDELARRMVEEDCCWEMITFLNYVLSAYPDDSWTGGLFDAAERERMLEHSWKHWRRHSPYLKGYLALTLARAGRAEDAQLVFDSIMDSSKTDPDLGTYWAPEERAWLWYNDTIEGHAFALRTMTELAPDDARRHGLVQWLLLNKKLNHWKSTRATAEVLYAMVHYLEREGALGVREEVGIDVGPRSWRMTFEPDELQPEIVESGAAAAAEDGEPLGKPNQILIPGPEVTPAMATVVVEKSTPGFLFASATWHFSTDELPAEARGDLFQVNRSYFRRVHDGREWTLEPLADGARVEVGDGVEVHLSIRARHAAEYVHLRDPRGAGFEPETLRSGYKWDLGISWYEEVRDSGTNFFFEWLPAGEYTFRYRLRATTGGTFRVGPATLQSMYAPEFTAYSAGDRLGVE